MIPMKPGTEFHMPAKVIAHLDGGFTRVKLLVPGGDFGDTDYPVWEIPTDCFPLDLRKIGSRIMVHHTTKQAESKDTAEIIRADTRKFVIESLSEADEIKSKNASPRLRARPVNWPKKQ